MRSYVRGDRDAQGKVVIDPDKAADVPITGMTVRGVELSSRYGKGHEYQSMTRVVQALPEDLTRRLRLIFCDSKAGSTYSVEGTLNQRDLDLIGSLFSELDGGHNGIFGDGGLCVDADWNEGP